MWRLNWGEEANEWEVGVLGEGDGMGGGGEEEGGGGG